jgi:signal transduction histidine kinase
VADFAELVTAALANVDAREQLAASRVRIVEAGYEERRRLGRDPHDGAQQEFVAARSPMPVELEDSPAERLPVQFETTAYFVVAEALTNAAKHARCSYAAVGVSVEDGRATVEVRDDGVGGAAASTGTGLRGLADRVNALGGEVEIESPPGGGTTIRARICAREAGC